MVYPKEKSGAFARGASCRILCRFTGIDATPFLQRRFHPREDSQTWHTRAYRILVVFFPCLPYVLPMFLPGWSVRFGVILTCVLQPQGLGLANRTARGNPRPECLRREKHIHSRPVPTRPFSIGTFRKVRNFPVKTGTLPKVLVSKLFGVP